MGLVKSAGKTTGGSSSSSSSSSPPGQQQRHQRQGRVIGIDLLPVQPPVPGATLLQGDFTDPRSRAELLRVATVAATATTAEGAGAEGRSVGVVDVVLSDLAPNFSGDHHTDHVRTLQLCYEVGQAEQSEGDEGGVTINTFVALAPHHQVFEFAAAAFALAASSAGDGVGRRRSSKQRGTVLCKYFKGRDEAAFLAHVRNRCALIGLLLGLDRLDRSTDSIGMAALSLTTCHPASTNHHSYAEVRLLKPKASRAESSETYVFARGFRPRPSSSGTSEEDEEGGASKV